MFIKHVGVSICDTGTKLRLDINSTNKGTDDLPFINNRDPTVVYNLIISALTPPPPHPRECTLVSNTNNG